VQEPAKEWPLPEGKDSKPVAITVDAKNRLWIAESGPQPGKLVGFDPKTTKFFGESALPSSAGAAVDLHFDAKTGGLWFATADNKIGFAKVP
jgi:virginiamycin B lyase